MKILHLPYNIAQWSTINTNALRAEGHEAKGLVFAEKSILHSHDDIIYVNQNGFFSKLNSFFIFLRHVLWADVIHWYWDEKVFPNNLALKVIKWLKKPVVVEWLGSEIRRPEVEFNTNPFFTEEYYRSIYKVTVEEMENQSRSLQKKFGDYGFCSITCPEMSQYLYPKYFQNNYTLRQRINTQTILSKVQDLESQLTKNGAIKVAHAPSHPVAKGSSHVEAAVKKLQKEGYKIEFDLIHKIPHEEALQRINQCDIYIDQLITGTYGMATLEALTLNKTVMVYIKEKALKYYPENLPVINVNPRTIESKLKMLLDQPETIQKTDNLGSDYVKEFHDTKKLIPRLVEIYEETINMRKKL